MKLIVGLHAILTAALVVGCGKEEDSSGGGAATEETAGVNGGEQPVDNGGGGTVTPPVCASDEKLDGATCVALALTELTSRGDCHKHSGYWYDKADVTITADAQYDSLKPSCHETRNEACPASGEIPVGKDKYSANVDFAGVTEQHVYQSVSRVYTTFRCFGGNDLQLYFQSTDMKEFDAGLNPDVKHLYLDQSTQLERIFFRASMPKLEELSIINTKVPASDFTGLTTLKGLDVGGVVGLTSLDVSKLVNLQWLAVNNTGLTALDLSKNDHLYAIDVSATTIPIASLNLARYSQFFSFSARDRGLTSFAGIPVAGLYYLSIDGANMPSIDLSVAPNLLWFSCSGCGTTSVNLASSPDIYFLNLRDNDLSTLDVSPLYQLDYLIASNNDLTTLDVAFNPELRHLEAATNGLTSLDVTNNPKLQLIDVRSNDLTYNGMMTKWDLSDLPDLDTLYITDNPNLVLNFESGVTTHANLVDGTNYSMIYVEEARWASFNGPNKPANWVFWGTDPNGYYTLP